MTYVARVVAVEDGTGFQIAVNNEGDAFYVTDCCGASAKGCDGYTGCRACYEEIDPGLGGVPAVEWFAPHRREAVRKANEFFQRVLLRSLRGASEAS